MAGRYAGRMQQWDVVNEIFDDNAELRTTGNIWIRELGPEIIADCFRWAHEADPEALLFFNDYNVDGINAKSDAYYALIVDLLADGVPVHGFSTQGHLSIRYGFPDDLADNLQRFADLGPADGRHRARRAHGSGRGWRRRRRSSSSSRPTTTAA